MRQYITGLGAFIKMDTWTDYAITYWSLGYNPIPCGIDSKRSICKWGEYQDRRISYDEILNFGENYPWANIAIITGEISYLVVVDVDGPEGQDFLIQLKGFPAYLPTVRTGRGYHYYFRYPDFELSTMNDTELKIDTYYQILNVISWDLKSIVKDEFFELLAEQDPIQFEGGAEHVDFDEDPYSDYLLNEFGDTYIEGFVTTVKHFWKKNKSKIR